MSMIINVEIPHDRYAEIEEYCMNKAISLPAYFLALHELNKIHSILENHDKTERVQEFHRKFESVAKHELPKTESNQDKIEKPIKETLTQNNKPKKKS